MALMAARLIIGLYRTAVTATPSVKQLTVESLRVCSSYPTFKVLTVESLRITYDLL